MKILESSDTIAAISTAIGEGGIGIVRLSGPSPLILHGEYSSQGKRCQRL